MCVCGMYNFRYNVSVGVIIYITLVAVYHIMWIGQSMFDVVCSMIPDHCWASGQQFRTVLYSAVLYCTIQCCTVLYYTVLYYTAI